MQELIEKISFLFQDLMLSRHQVEDDDAGWVIGRAGAKYRAVAISTNRAEVRERCLEWPQHLAFQLKQRKLTEPSFGIRTDDPIRSGTGIRRCTEFPQRRAELGGQWREGFRCPRGKIKVV